VELTVTIAFFSVVLSRHRCKAANMPNPRTSLERMKKRENLQRLNLSELDLCND
jgi:hypothetical protein